MAGLFDGQDDFSFRDGNRSLVIPCPPDQFSEFITKLLGRPQSVGRIIPGPFEVDLDKAINVHHLLQDRIIRQNASSLISTEALIQFDDNSTVTLNSIDDFLSFNAIHPISSTALKMSWTYLIKFNDGRPPEKQDINISFSSGSVHLYENEIISTSSKTHRVVSGSIAYNIGHTDRSWGNDIDALLNGHLKNFVVEGPVVAKILHKRSFEIGLATFCTIMGISVFGVFATIRGINSVSLSKFNEVVGENPETISIKINMLFDYLVDSRWTNFGLFTTFFMLVMFVISIGLALKTADVASSYLKSYVILTPESKKKRDSDYRSLSRGRGIIILSIIGSVLIGILSNGIYSFVSKYLLF